MMIPEELVLVREQLSFSHLNATGFTLRRRGRVLAFVLTAGSEGAENLLTHLFGRIPLFKRYGRLTAYACYVRDGIEWRPYSQVSLVDWLSAHGIKAADIPMEIHA